MKEWDDFWALDAYEVRAMSDRAIRKRADERAGRLDVAQGEVFAAGQRKSAKMATVEDERFDWTVEDVPRIEKMELRSSGEAVPKGFQVLEETKPVMVEVEVERFVLEDERVEKTEEEVVMPWAACQVLACIGPEMAMPAGSVCVELPVFNLESRSWVLAVDREMERGDVTWAEAVQDAEDAEDAEYVRMTEEEFQAEKRRVKESRKFKCWDDWLSWAIRVERKRRVAAAGAGFGLLRRERPYLQVLLHLREDYRRMPCLYFTDKKEMEREMYKIDEEIASQPGGAYRLHLVYEEEKKAAAPELNALVVRIRRQAQALRTCRAITAGKRIAASVGKLWMLKKVAEMRKNAKSHDEMSVADEIENMWA